ncbi:hypothetical protein D3C87_1415250 [compost metagenome]
MWPTSTGPRPWPMKHSMSTAIPRSPCVRRFSNASPTISIACAKRWPHGPPSKPACRKRNWKARQSKRPPSSASSPMWCARGVSCNWPSTRRSPSVSHARAWIIACKKSPSARWRFSARATSPSPTRWPVAIPRRRWRRVRPSFSRRTTRIPAPRRSRPVPSARRCKTADCPKACSPWCVAPAMPSAKRWSIIR